MVAKGAVIRIDGEPNFYKPIEYQDLIRSIKEETEKNIACAERELQQLATENADVDYVMNIVGEENTLLRQRNLSTARKRKFRCPFGESRSKCYVVISKTQYLAG